MPATRERQEARAAVAAGSQRGAASFLSLLLLSMLVIAATRFAPVADVLRLPFVVAVFGVSVILLVVALATTAFHAYGPRSRAYAALDRLETVAIQLSLVGFAYASRHGALSWLFWLFYLAHAMAIGIIAPHRWSSRIVVASAPATVAVLEVVRGEYASSVVAVANALLGTFLVALGQETTRRVAALDADRARLSEELAGLRVEKERRRLARELHDGVAADLSALTARLDLLSNDVRQDSVRQGLRELHQRTATSIDEMRSIVWALRAPDRDAGELASYVELRCRELCPPDTRFELVTTEATGDALLPGEVCLHALRIAQELVRNAIRHGRARTIALELRVDHEIVVAVVDDGAGLGGDELAQILRRTDGGLANLRGRATDMGGALTVARGPGGAGLRAEAKLPIAIAAG